MDCDIRFLSGEAAQARVRELGRPYTLLLPFLGPEGMRRGIVNAGDCRMEVMEVGGRGIPLVINPGTARASVVLSAVAHFVRAAAEEVGRSPIFPLIRWPAVLGLHLLGLFCRPRLLDRSVFINNWVVLTRMRTGYSFSPVEEWLLPVRERYPDHAVLSSIMPEQEPERAQVLRQAGFQFIPYRTVYLFNPGQWKRRIGAKRKTLKRELLHLRAHSYEMLTARDDLSRLCPRELRRQYRRIYMEKYSADNPDLTEDYFRNLIETKPLEMLCLLSGGDLAGFGTWAEGPEWMYSLSVGQIEDEPAPVSPYRLLFAYELQRSLESGLIYDMGSGVGGFKRARGARPAQEYLAVYDRHLPLAPRLAWRLMGTVYRFFAPLFRDKVMR